MKQQSGTSFSPVTPLMGEVEAEVLRLAREQPELGQAAVAQRLQQQGLKISPSGVRYLWQKHDLETAVKRLRALTTADDVVEQNVDPLTDRQRRLLERGLLSHQLAQGEEGHGDEAGSSEVLDRRSIILNVAAERFAEQGYDRTSIRDIASSAGLLPGSVYHHFASKDELYVTVHAEGLRSVKALVEAAAEQGVDPWDRLVRAFTVHVDCMVGDVTPIQRLTGHGLALTGHSVLLEKIRADREAYEGVIRDLIAVLPLVDGADRSLLRLMLLGATNWVYVWYREGKRTPAGIAQGMVDMVRYGVGAGD